MALIADGAPRVVTRRFVRQRGVTDDAIFYRLRSGSWTRLGPGIYLTTAPATALDRVVAAGLHGGPRATVSGAAALHQFGLLRQPPARELVLVPPDCFVHTHQRIHVRRTTRPPLGVSPFATLAPVARAVADHVRLLTLQDDVTHLVTAAVQRGLCTLDQLADEYRLGARRGSRLLRIALEDAGAGAASAPEALAARLLRAAGISDYAQNAPVLACGRIFYGDFVWRELRAILEIDSTEHHFQPDDQTRTLERDQSLQLAGWSVMHVKPSQLRVGAGFVALVQGWLSVLTRSAAS